MVGSSFMLMLAWFSTVPLSKLPVSLLPFLVPFAATFAFVVGSWINKVPLSLLLVLLPPFLLPA